MIASSIMLKMEEMTVHVDELVQLSNKSPKHGGGISWRTIIDRLDKLSSDEIQLLCIQEDTFGLNSIRLSHTFGLNSIVISFRDASLVKL